MKRSENEIIDGAVAKEPARVPTTQRMSAAESSNGNANGTSRNKKRPLDALLDSVVLGAAPATDGTAAAVAAAAASAPKEPFLASSSFAGSKTGYYFGTGPLGTGYYLDDENSDNKKDGAGTAAASKRKKGVQFAEDRNETRLLYAPPQQLLQQAEEQAKQVKVIDLTVKGVKQAGVALQKAVERNAMQRAQHADDPAAYMESEVALFEHITVLKALAADPVKLYPAVVQHELLSAGLIPLLLHENTDIVSSVVSVCLEWLDASLLLSESSAGEEEEGTSSSISALAALAGDFLQNGGAEFLVDNLGRFVKQQQDNSSSDNDDEDDDEVGRGAEDCLTLLENLMEMDLMVQANGADGLLPNDMSVAAMLCQATRLVPWLLQQIEQNDDNDDSVSAFYKGRSLELLALLTPREDVYTAMEDWSQIPPYTSSLLEENDNEKKPTVNGSATIDAIEILLQEIAVYRKKQPADEQQVESLENACMILASLLTYSSKNVHAFLDRQGIELVIRCLKERVHAGGVALKLLDFSGSDPVYQKACEHMVDAGALKYLFPIFMGRNVPKPAPAAASSKKAKKDWVHSIEPTIIRILYALIRHLTDDSPNDAKKRFLAKFIGDERCDRIVEQCISYDQKARLAEYKFFRSELEDEIQDESAVQLAAFNTKLAGGGDVFHRLAAIAAFCCVGSKRCHERILSQLALQQSGISLIRDGIQEFASVLETSPQKSQLEGYLDQI